jgi:hypothetical protein
VPSKQNSQRASGIDTSAPPGHSYTILDHFNHFSILV